MIPICFVSEKDTLSAIGVVVRMLIFDTKVDGSIPSINMFSP